MGLIITPQREIDAYFESEALSQSKLKSLLGGLENFLSYQEDDESANYYEEKTHLLLGSAIDMKLTGEDNIFGNYYHISAELEDKPSDVEMSLIQQVVDELRSEGVLSQMGELIDAYDMLKIAAVDQQWYKGNPGDKRLTGLAERGNAYFKDVVASSGKQVISRLEHNIIQGVCESLKSHSVTSDLFDREAIRLNQSVRVTYQKPIYFTYKGIECKALLDIFVEFLDEHGNVEQIMPVDLKTKAGSTLRFLDSARSFRYDIQAAWYTLAIATAYPDIPVKEFRFVVESTTKQGTPLIFSASPEFIQTGREGKPEELIGSRYTLRQIKGYEQLLNDYNFYKEIDFAYARELHGKNNTFVLNSNSIE